jgi:hypothetical protein
MAAVKIIKVLRTTLRANEVFRGSQSAKRAQNQTPVWCESLRLNGEPLKIWVSNHDNFN